MSRPCRLLETHGCLALLCLFFMLSCDETAQDSALESEESIASQKDVSAHNSGLDLKFVHHRPEQSGVDFVNTLQENDNYNILSYEYLYNGAGVAAGDVNNDGLVDLFFAGNLTADQLYLNLGDMKFRNVSQSAGIMSTGFSTGVVMADVNGDGWLDIYVCRSFVPNPEGRKNVLLINNKNGTFSDKAAEFGIADPSFSSHASFFDYDLDGDLDMYLLNHRTDFNRAQNVEIGSGGKVSSNEPYSPFVSDRFYRNDGGKYIDVTKSLGLLNNDYGLSLATGDINNDGYPDLYIANDYVDRDLLYLNNRKGGFDERLVQHFGHTSRNSMGSDLADINNDGHLDLLTLDMVAPGNKRQKTLKGVDPYDKYHNILVRYGEHHQVMRNTLQINDGTGLFSEVSGLVGISNTDWSWSPLFADFDNDGSKDLFISNGLKRDITNMDFIKYTMEEEVRKAGGFQNVPKMNLVTKMPSTKRANYIYRNLGDIRFEDKTKAWGISIPSHSQGATYADLDNDGDLDLVLNNLDEPAMILENRLKAANYVKVKLQGNKQNVDGLGARVCIKAGGQVQTQELSTNRGYYSSVSSILHFGLGESDQIEELEVFWPGGAYQKQNDLAINQLITIKQSDAKSKKPRNSKKPENLPLAKDQNGAGIDFTHVENEFVDFKREPLLPHMFSNRGPCMASGDVNGDGLEDLFIGGAEGQTSAIFLQNSSGFRKNGVAVLESDRSHEDQSAVFFDVDQDKDLDLYVVSGGAAKLEGDAIYQDRLYLNDGKGNFSKASDRLPDISSSGSCVVPFDFDRDGDLDLFVGAGIKPNHYPVSPQSQLLLNQEGSFTSSSKLLPEEGHIGLVTDAVATDYNGDGYSDLIVVGECMNILVLEGQKDGLVSATEKLGLDKSSGWWNCIVESDFDNDGDLDYLIGNRGLNSFYKASPDRPAKVYVGDFDKNGNTDFISTYYFEDGASYPKHTRDQLFEELPMVRKKFARYSDYARAGIDDILEPGQLTEATVFEVHTFASCLLVNESGKSFSLRPLPNAAQVAPIKDMLPIDLNADKHMDYMIVGNEFGTEVETGRFDAFTGLVLMGDENAELTALGPSKTGYQTRKDGRSILLFNSNKQTKPIIVVGNNNDKVDVFRRR